MTQPPIRVHGLTRIFKVHEREEGLLPTLRSLFARRLVYCVVLVLATVAFWATRIENLLAIFWSFLDAGRFPVDVYPGWRESH